MAAREDHIIVHEVGIAVNVDRVGGIEAAEPDTGESEIRLGSCIFYNFHDQI